MVDYTKKTYSLAETAVKVGRPRTTLADWRHQFREFIPSVGEGRRERYTDEAAEIFALIGKMKDAQEPPEIIREQLRGVVREIVIHEEPDLGMTPFFAGITQDVQDLKAAVVELKIQLNEIQATDGGTRQAVEDVSRRIEAVTEKMTAIDEIKARQDAHTDALTEIGEALRRIDTHGKGRKWFEFWR